MHSSDIYVKEGEKQKTKLGWCFSSIVCAERERRCIQMLNPILHLLLEGAISTDTQSPPRLSDWRNARWTDKLQSFGHALLLLLHPHTSFTQMYLDCVLKQCSGSHLGLNRTAHYLPNETDILNKTRNLYRLENPSHTRRNTSKYRRTCQRGSIEAVSDFESHPSHWNTCLLLSEASVWTDICISLSSRISKALLMRKL